MPLDKTIFNFSMLGERWTSEQNVSSTSIPYSDIFSPAYSGWSFCQQEECSSKRHRIHHNVCKNGGYEHSVHLRCPQELIWKTYAINSIAVKPMMGDSLAELWLICRCVSTSSMIAFHPLEISVQTLFRILFSGSEQALCSSSATFVWPFVLRQRHSTASVL
jgi:hypothetical protein